MAGGRRADPFVVGRALGAGGRSPFDLSLENRRRTGNRVVFEAAGAMRHYGVGLKAATITPEGKHDVGSPNAILRDEIDAQIILRTGRRIPGVRPVTARRRQSGRV